MPTTGVQLLSQSTIHPGARGAAGASRSHSRPTDRNTRHIDRFAAPPIRRDGAEPPTRQLDCLAGRLSQADSGAEFYATELATPLTHRAAVVVAAKTPDGAARAIAAFLAIGAADITTELLITTGLA